jgi:hypothetical protein
MLPVLLLGSLAGCLPWPHTTPRSAAVSGRVLDARTHLPIKGAAVFLLQSPTHTTYTDKDGFFHLKATRNVHFGYIPPEGEWPDNKDSSMEISHTNYFPIAGVWSGNIGDIFLKPKQ